MNATHIRGWQAAILAGLLLIGLNAGPPPPGFTTPT